MTPHGNVSYMATNTPRTELIAIDRSHRTFFYFFVNPFAHFVSSVSGATTRVRSHHKTTERTTAIEVTCLGRNLDPEIGNFDLSQPLTDSEFAGVYRAFFENEVFVLLTQDNTAHD